MKDTGRERMLTEVTNVSDKCFDHEDDVDGILFDEPRCVIKVKPYR